MSELQQRLEPSAAHRLSPYERSSLPAPEIQAHDSRPSPLSEGARREPMSWDELSPAGWYACHGRRLFDLVLLAVLLPMALAPMALIALCNWVLFRDRRRIFFCQERVGWRGRTFAIYKFRTMREVSEGAMMSWASGADRQRVTRFGRFLRNSHLDELPQLYNVLRGDMQLIGPRPEEAVAHWSLRGLLRTPLPALPGTNPSSTGPQPRLRRIRSRRLVSEALRNPRKLQCATAS